MIYLLGFIALYLAVTVLYVGSEFIIPFVVAVAIFYLFISLVDGVRTLQIKGIRCPKWAAYGAAVALLALLIWGVVLIFNFNVAALLDEAPRYQERFLKISDRIIHDFPFIRSNDFHKMFPSITFISVIQAVAQFITDMASYAGIILIYFIFMFTEYHILHAKIRALTKKETRYQKVIGVMDSIHQRIQSYIRIKTLLSVLTASLSYIILMFVGVDFASFWAFVIFLLNYIPTIGSIVATIFPCLLTLVQFDGFGPFIFVTIFLVIIQLTMGNMVEPRVMGGSFNLSPLLIILSLTFWGAIWGVIGMVLAVPMMVVLNIILAQMEATRPIALMLTRDGKL